MQVTSLRKKSEFQLLFKGGKRVFRDHISISYLFIPSSSLSPVCNPRVTPTTTHSVILANAGMTDGGSGSILYEDDGKGKDDQSINYLKIAYVVSKKISPKAVVRNKIKRRMRAVVRQVLKDKEEQLNALKTTLLVSIRASSNKIIDAPFQQIQLEIKQAFERLI